MSGVLSRRALLAAGAAAGALAAVAGGVGALAEVASPLNVIRGVVRRRIPEPRIPLATIDAFHREAWPELSRRLGARARLLLAMMELGHPMTDSLDSETLEGAERQIVTAFLLGSDFFRTGTARDRRVSWVGMGQTCQNPFRRG